MMIEDLGPRVANVWNHLRTTTRNQVEQASARQEARRVADACATVLSQQTQSAEAFAQLIVRAHQRKDYARVDALAALLPQRLAPSEMAELGRANNVVV